jgi:hypothetical protein
MSHSTRVVGLLMMATLLLAGCQGEPTIYGQGGVVVRDGHSSVAIVFSESDRHHIHDYYQAHHDYYRRYKPLPPGLAKREQLPPGLAKKQPLPPGLHGYRLPYELDRRLSRLPEGIVRLRIGTDIVLMESRTRLILDIIRDIPND